MPRRLIDAALAAVLAATDVDAIRKVWTDRAGGMNAADRQRLTEEMNARKAELATPEPTLDGAP